MTANLHLRASERLRPLESYFRDTAEYFGIKGVPDAFVETLERVRNRRGDKDFRADTRVSEPRVMSTCTQGSTVFT